MTRRSGPTVGRRPHDFIAAGAWPDGTLVADAPAAAVYVLAIARRLRDALTDEQVADIATRADLARSTIYDILSGESWPDVVTLAQLEDTLNTRLWPT